MLLYPTFIPNQIHYIMLGIKLGIKIKNFKLSYKVSSFPFAFSGIGFSVSPPATFAFITSSFAFRDTLSAGASAYCLMPLSCPVPTVLYKKITLKPPEKDGLFLGVKVRMITCLR